MSEQQLRGIQGRVIKWDGDPPVQWVISSKWPFLRKQLPDPFGHPKCYEIVEFGDGRGLAVTYKRAE